MRHSSKINITFSSYILFGRSIDIARDMEWIMLNDTWVKNGKTTSELCVESLCLVTYLETQMAFIEFHVSFLFFCFGIEFVVSSLNRSMWAMRLCVRVYGCMFDEKLCICAMQLINTKIGFDEEESMWAAMIIVIVCVMFANNSK